MKAAAVFKIVIWSLIAVVLIGTFVAMVNTSSFSLPFFNLSRLDQNVHVIREQRFPSESIDSIDIKWTSGSMYILPTDGNSIIVTEKSNRELSEKELLQISIKNGRLTMDQGEMDRRFFLFSIGEIIVTEIRLPEKQYNEIKTKMTSGKLEMDGLDAKTILAEMTSGLINFSSLTAENLIIDMTSGKVDVAGTFDDIYVDSTSGVVNIKNEQAPTAMLIKMSSGKATVTIPDNTGFSIAKKLTSGVFRSDFDIDDFGRYKDGGYKYRVTMTSGVFELKKQ